MLILDRQVDSFKQDRVVTVVLVDVLGDLHILVDSFDLAINCTQQLCIAYWRREHLQNLQNFDLKPGARSHVVIVVLTILLHITQDLNKLWYNSYEGFITKHLNRRPQQRAC